MIPYNTIRANQPARLVRRAFSRYKPGMSLFLKRFVRASLCLFAAVGLAQAPLDARTAKRAPVAAPAKVDTTPWLYKGSDIPPDPAWTFGVLPNGVRYAVRRNGVPPGQVSIRVGIDAGALHERDSELGFAHFLEHLSFRGSKYLSDGEAKRVWQRLGASFGSDTNALTSHTQTIYKLDLPEATEAGLDESLKILSGMMEGPTITQAEVDAERRTILAEQREQFAPGIKVYDATRALFFHGQPMATRSPIGTTATLQAATPAALRAFHQRWYRPDKAIIVIAGDGDPARYAELVTKHFSAWKPAGPVTPEPDFGKPDAAAPVASVLVEPGVPMSVSMAVLRPWVQKADTIAYNQGRLTDMIALRLINRRLERRARAGASYLQAQVSQEDVSRSADSTFVSIQPLGDDWQKALLDVRAVIADALEHPSTQDEIDREAGEFFSALQVAVETERTESAAKQADDILGAVNIRETVATAQVAAEVFGGLRGKITPDIILASTKSLFSGTPPRAILTTPSPLPDGQKVLASALTAPVVALANEAGGTGVSFADLAPLGTPGKVVRAKRLDEMGMEMVEFSNGTKAILFLNPAETGKVYVQARFGNGRLDFPHDRPSLAWAGESMLAAGGIGPFNEDALDRLTSGRLLSMNFDVTDNAFVLKATTRAADLPDQLQLFAQQLANPKWDPAPIVRARAALLASYDSTNASAQTVLGRDMGSLLNGGDTRWRVPDKAEVAAITPDLFRKTWEPLLKRGTIELLVFGDAKRADVISAIANSIGALPKRKDKKIAKARAGSPGPIATTTPTILRHDGAADQAAALVAWPIGAGLADMYEARKLDVLGAIFSDRMFDRYREQEGQSYSPSASSNWPWGLTSGGSFVVIAQPKPDGVDRFYAITDEIAADLAAKPPTDDELKRAVGPMIEMLNRASSGNTFWMMQMAGATRDPRRQSALKSLMSDFRRITPAELQGAAQRWLVPGKAMRASALPK